MPNFRFLIAELFTLDGTITKKFLEAMTVISHTCRGINMNTLVLVTVDFRLCLNNTFKSLKKRRLLETDTLLYGTMLS